jgi:hypothetical protein
LLRVINEPDRQAQTEATATIAIQSAGVIAWTCSESAWESAADKVDVLSEQESGHQYLDDPSDITVMASIAEYGEVWWGKHA